MPGLLWELLLVWPANVIAHLVAIPLGLAPLLAGIATWVWMFSKFSSRAGKLKRAAVFVLGGAAGAYVFLLTGTAVVYLARVIMKFGNSN